MLEIEEFRSIQTFAGEKFRIKFVLTNRETYECLEAMKC